MEGQRCGRRKRKQRTRIEKEEGLEDVFRKRKRSETKEEEGVEKLKEGKNSRKRVTRSAAPYASRGSEGLKGINSYTRHSPF